MRLNFSHCSDPGQVRPNNQDAYSVDLLDPRGNAALLIVADGMGGYEGGEIASRLAVETVRSRVLTAISDWAERGTLGDGLVQAFDAANRAILQAQVENPDAHNMGTTLTAALVWADRIIVAHMGDSKACLVHGEEATMITSDHNVAGELMQSGHLTAQQAAVHPQRHVLTRALGIGEAIVVERRDLTWQPGDTLLLMTDGLSNLVPTEEIAALLPAGFSDLSERLVGLANARGGSDNITVLAARWEG
ncbi:MAG TPA: PP2C family serine/threonine-protein phosphatase [Symbiobacteriaceae bacterium]|nr:PP2C family serine/threonine-protein phosphatase [Symbiobacteriaceae bacterium]